MAILLRQFKSESRLPAFAAEHIRNRSAVRRADVLPLDPKWARVGGVTPEGEPYAVRHDSRLLVFLRLYPTARLPFLRWTSIADRFSLIDGNEIVGLRIIPGR
jgi:hypothetical protein